MSPTGSERRALQRPRSALATAILAAACGAAREELRESDGASPRVQDGRSPGVPAAASGVRYLLELVQGTPPRVRVTVEAEGDADGETELTLNEGWGGIQETGEDLELVEARGAAGGELASERPSLGAWKVRHAPLERISAAFELGPTAHRATPMPPEYYLPILEPGLLHAIGAQTLPAPEHLDGELERPIELEWRGFAERGWDVISSFGAGEEPLTLRRALDDFRHALFLAGDLRLLERDVRGRPVYVAIHGEGWGFSDEEFADLARRIVALEREFFADFECPFYLISAIGVGQRSGGSSYGGTGLTDSFALFLTPGMGLDSGGGGGIAWLLAHELFHDWNGHLIRLAAPEELGYWFSEGFTDFYARRLLHAGGLLAPGALVDSWNRKLAAYAVNPRRTAPAETIREAFWTERDVGELPYQRGDLVALLVDHAIRERSGGARSLDDLMRELARRARAADVEFSSADLVAAIGEFAGPETAETVRAIVVDGAPIELPPDVGGPELALEPAEIARFDTGFDHERSIEEGRVSGVRPGSCAERAGLEDGMQVRGWSVHFGRTDVPIEMRVKDGEVERTLSFLPQGEPLPGYRFRPR